MSVVAHIFIIVIVSSMSFIISIVIVMICIIIMSCCPWSSACAFPSVIQVFCVYLGSLRAAAIGTRWAGAGGAAVWHLIRSPMFFDKGLALPAWTKDLSLRATMLMQEGRECVHAFNAMVLQLRQESPVLVLVALGQELPREIGLPLLDLVQPSCQYAVVERCCGAFSAGAAL